MTHWPVIDPDSFPIWGPHQLLFNSSEISITYPKGHFWLSLVTRGRLHRGQEHRHRSRGSREPGCRPTGQPAVLKAQNSLTRPQKITWVGAWEGEGRDPASSPPRGPSC